MAAINLKGAKFKPIYFWSVPALMVFSSLVMLILTYLIYTNFTIEHAKKYDQSKQEEQVLREDLINKYRLVKSVDQYLQKMSELSRLESVISQQFPKNDDLPNLLIQINQLAENSNISISNLLPNREEKVITIPGNGKNNVKIWSKSFTMNATANYLDFMSFVYAIAKFQRVMQLDNLQINRVDDNNVNITLALTIFYSN